MKKNDRSRRKFRTRSVSKGSIEAGAASNSKSLRSQSEVHGEGSNEKLHCGDRSNEKLQRGNRRSEKLQNEQNSECFKRNRQLSHFPFKFIQSLLEKPLEEVVQMLIVNEHFFNYIAKKLSPDYVVLIVKLLGRFCDFDFANLRIQILQKSLNSGFLNNLQAYISSLAVQTAKDKQFNSYYWADPDAFWSNMIKFGYVLLKEIPHFFVDNLLKLVKITLMNIPHIEIEHQVHICDKTKNDLKNMISKAEEFIAAGCQNLLSGKKEITDDSEEEPPTDFHEMSILPTSDELINTNKPFVRRNIVGGSYKDVQQYLDIQFRLLREDFVGPLRLGIHAHLSGKKNRDIQDIKIHPKVQFLNPVTLTEDYCVLLKFHFGGKLSNFEFEDSRKFMYGSLVCFTKDNFNSIIFGRIVDSKIENKRNGQLVIGFDETEDLALNTDYIMVECSIYFEPYYHVLKVLKRIEEEDFPMKNYIVYVDRTVLIPNYGNPSIPYQILNYQQEQTCYIFRPGVSYTFNDLNKSQNDAFIAALTRQFSIIQGPPGTGKTYVGLKVARTLLDNSDVWFQRTPMLVICYTNHALDQFLEGLIGTTNQILRIGGQSKNENMKKFNIREHAHRMNSSVWKAKLRVTECLNIIKNVSDILCTITGYNSILSIKQLADVIPNFHQSWLYGATDKDFLEWLLDDNILKNEDETTEDHLSLDQKFGNLELEDTDSESIDTQDDQNEPNILDELLSNRILHMQCSSLELRRLETEIRYITKRMVELESHMTDNTEYLFEHMTLGVRNEKLKALYESVKTKLAMAHSKITEVPLDTDARKSRYIPLNERWNLYFYWLNLHKEKLLEKHKKYNLEYRRAYEVFNELKEMGNVEILREMKVIGMTTTSAARLHSSLQLLRSPIVIVEEAAEVLEAHIVSALTKHCQQLILIGDHQQLRPSTANYRMEKEYKLGISLFERMIMNEVQCFTLDTQHRMRPEISSLIKPSIYPNLKDHESVFNRPQIKGVEKCLFFIDHKVPEESNLSNSKKNIHESKFLIQLARYLILNGYESHQITILAAYLGQMFEIQKLQKKTEILKGVRVSVLDNYQGEESDIILLSLVRSNENTIGFLSIENRVCVALSRARNGLYIMGNMSLLCEKSKLWVEIRETLLAQGAIGSALSLKCQNHSKITMVSTEKDFYSVPEGGCNEICNTSLVCGHKCKMLCHVLDTEHERYICTENCNKLLCDSDLRHICRKSCGEECGLCEYPKNEILDCGHETVMPCHMNPEDYKCITQVQVTLPCEHVAMKPCHIETKLYKCVIPCDARLDCGHSCVLNCHRSKDPDHLKYKCRKPCAKLRFGCTNLKDGTHKCTRLCHEECEPCKKIVRKSRTVCPHYYDVPCNQNVDEIECLKPCKIKLDCGHICPNTCDDECATTCTKRVKKRIPGCNHTVDLPCNVLPDKIYCNKKCPRVMVCGHICGEICKKNCEPSNCKKMLKVAILAKCGHIVNEVPCFVNTLYKTKGESSVDDLISYCTEPCTATLNCSPEDKHLCSGTCGSCYQGRIHKRCSKKCSRILICNHECKGLCRQACKPCSMKCSYRCKHSVCTKRCGDQCTKCTEVCNRHCKHQRCSKFCGDICNVPPCEEACEKRLKCGHPCIGLCSEPCPPLCRICNKEEVEEVFFGTEDEEDARFILLNDCGHILENSGMKEWMEKSVNKIGFKVCPKCKTNIFMTERYSDYVKKSVETISLAKIKEIGTEENISAKRSELKLRVRNLSFPVRLATNLQKSLLENQRILLDRLLKVDKMERRQRFNLVELNAIEIKYQLMEQVFKIMNISDLNDLTPSSEPPVTNQVNLILGNLLREVDDITTTEIEDIQREINRLHRMIQVLPLLNLMKYQESNSATKIENLNKQINILSKYDNALDDIVKQELSDLRKELSLLSITELEKKEIVKAMGLARGHWYMCPNGHPYVITECGGAMEEGTCLQCKAPIGGQNHRLLNTNRVATFMDGATHGAWSEYQNMNNYDY